MKTDARRKLLDDCFLHDRERLRHGEAIAILRRRLGPMVGGETIRLKDAAGRITAAAIRAPRDIPACDNAAVDGYAYARADLEQSGGRFPVVARIAAGDRAPHALGAATAARIFTGAMLPEYADTVAMQEDCQTDETDGRQFVRIPAGLKRGANVRHAGEDVRSQETVVEPGQVLSPQYLAAIASTGADSIFAYRRLRVGLVSSGAEVRRPGGEPAAGEVFDANHYLLRGLLDPLKLAPRDLGVLPDNGEAVCEALRQAAANHDAIITTGGASRGDEDHFIAALDKLGKRHLWQLAIKPGRPMCFGQIGDAVVFSLPGNPVAAFVCFLLYVRPALIVLGGGRWPEPRRFPVRSGFAVTRKKTGRREFWRGWLEYGDEQTPIARKFERDGSGLISGLRLASGLIEVPEEVSEVSPGDTVAFLPFSEFGIPA
jgi:molybdopterin molybdotransferase